VKKAVLFEQAVSQSSWTLPAHVSLLTSLYPISHGVDSSRRRLAGGVETLAVWLKKMGYYTGAMVSGPFMKKLYGFDRGFLDYDDDLAVVDNPHSVVTSPRIHEKAERFLAKHGNRPFFLFLHYWDVHYDYNPPAPCDTLFDKDYQGTLDARDFENNSAIHAGMDPRDMEHLEALYDGEIRFVDEYLGALFGELKKRRLMRETLIVITADHGDEFFEHGEKGHSHSLYEELIHVPLIIRPPGGAKGVRIDRPVALIDIAPTVMDLLGFGPEVAGAQGRSLKMLMEAPSSWRDEPIWSETRRARKDKRRYRGRLARSMRLGMLKGIHYEKKDLRPELYEYYDLATDPGEQAPVREDLLAEIDFPPFQEMLSDWVKAMEKTRPKGQEALIDPRTLEALQSLGYGGY
jgi:arylsulfatase